MAASSTRTVLATIIITGGDTVNTEIGWARTWVDGSGIRADLPRRREEGAVTEWRREPPVDELLSEPVIRLLMARDGVDEVRLRRLLAEIERRRRERRPKRRAG